MKSPNFLAQLLFYGFIISSIYTHPIQEYGSSPILGRMVWADVFGLLLVLLAISNNKMKMNPMAKGMFAFVLLLTPGIANSHFVFRSVVEATIFVFLTLVFTAGANAFQTEKDLHRLTRVIAFTALIASVFGIWENSTQFTGLPRLFGEDGRDYRSATFRNSGQAGAYLLVVLAAIIPVRYGRISKYMSVKDRRLFDVTIILSSLCILMTVKIAAYIGICVGVIGFAIYKRKWQFVVPTVAAVVLFQLCSPWIEDQFPRLANRFYRKTESRLDIQAVTSSSGFLADNYGKAMLAFSDNPLFGSGIMGFQGRHHKYEVHSTPMKLVGETGIFGCLGYLIFIYLLVEFYAIYQKYPKSNRFREYLEMMLPFMLGCAVSWLYTFHLRKREFWILMVLIVVVVRLLKASNPKCEIYPTNVWATEFGLQNSSERAKDYKK